MSFLEDVPISLDSGHSVDVMYLDFQKKPLIKFQEIDLMVKLHRLVIKGRCADWNNSWLKFILDLKESLLMVIFRHGKKAQATDYLGFSSWPSSFLNLYQ